MGLTKDDLKIKLEETFREKTKIYESFGEINIQVEKANYMEILKQLRDTFNFNLLIDITAVDEGKLRVVVHLYSLKDNLRVRVSSNVPDDLTMPSLVPVFKGALWLEREIYDLFGIKFEGHPNLKRILLWEGFPGHPLRKDYPLRKRPPLPEPK